MLADQDVHQLHLHFQILKDTMLFSSQDIPKLAVVIPAMDRIDEVLTTYSQDRKLSSPIHAAVTLAKKTLNRYYELTDSSDVYRIAMGIRIQILI